MYTRHARKRCQQRGIPREVVELLLSYGVLRHRHGAEVYYLDRAGRRQAAQALGRARFARIVDRLNTYIVVSREGSVITAAPRRKRLKY